MSERDRPRAERGPRALPRRRPYRAAATIAAVAGLLAAAGSVRAQPEDAVPRVPSGVNLVLAPVQSVAPTPSGAWPGGAGSRQDALAALNSEVDFAVSEEPLARNWTPPGEVVEQVRRNPLLDVDPEHLSYRGLLADRDEEELYSPLHGQVRRLSALLGARLVVVPLRVWYAPSDTALAGREDGELPRVVAGDRRVTMGGRAVARVALIDARAGRVLWKGEVASDPAPGDSPALLATLAANLVDTLIPS